MKLEFKNKMQPCAEEVDRHRECRGIVDTRDSHTFFDEINQRPYQKMRQSFMSKAIVHRHHHFHE